MFECELDKVDTDEIQLDVATAKISVYSIPENPQRSLQ
jgi:hypothetical protein